MAEVSDAVVGIVERLVRTLGPQDAPVALSQLCRAFLSETEMSLTSACGMRPAEFLEEFPGRLRLQDGFVTLIDKLPGPVVPEELLPAVAAATPGSDELPKQMARAIQDQLCLDVIVSLGGSVGRGTHTGLCRDVDLLLSCRVEPDARLFAAMSRPLLRTIEPLLRMLVVEEDGARVPLVTSLDPRGHLNIDVQGFSVRVLLAPQLGPGESVRMDRRLDGLGSVPTCSEAALVAWVRAQSQALLDHVRLVKHWASRRTWSSPYLMPPPLLLELLVIHTCLLGPQLLLERVFERLGRMDQCYITWEVDPAGHIRAAPEPLDDANPRPLVLDPFRGPGVNHAGPDRFDPQELLEHASAFLQADFAERMRQFGAEAKDEDEESEREIGSGDGSTCAGDEYDDAASFVSAEQD